MKLSLSELNDLYYCLGRVELLEMKLISDKKLIELKDKIISEICKVIEE